MRQGLRREWSRDPATPFVYTLLQSVWLASASAESVDEQLSARGERIEAPGAAWVTIGNDASLEHGGRVRWLEAPTVRLSRRRGKRSPGGTL